MFASGLQVTERLTRTGGASFKCHALTVWVQAWWTVGRQEGEFSCIVGWYLPNDAPPCEWIGNMRGRLTPQMPYSRAMKQSMCAQVADTGVNEWSSSLRDPLIAG